LNTLIEQGAHARRASSNAPMVRKNVVVAGALGLFAGLRPESEIWRLAWSNFDFEDREIDVQKSKNVASHRFARIPDDLLINQQFEE
jgi:integrase